MGRFETWLRREASVFSSIVWAILCLVLQKIYVFIFFYLISFAEIPVGENEVIRGIFELPLPSLFFMLVQFAFFEEVIFRLPISWIVKTSDKKLSGVIFASAVFSLLFGLAHSYVFSVFLQGVLGFLFCILYLKCGGFEGKILKPLIVTTLTHATYNFLLVFHI